MSTALQPALSAQQQTSQALAVAAPEQEGVRLSSAGAALALPAADARLEERASGSRVHAGPGRTSVGASEARALAAQGFYQEGTGSPP